MDLYDILHSIHGQESDGSHTVIRKGDHYLSGTPYLWSVFAERAYIFPSRAYAAQLIGQFPEELNGAVAYERTPNNEGEAHVE